MTDEVRYKWDERYAGDGYVFGEEPLPLLVEFEDLLPASGRALDIACGEGRNAVHLASRGLDVMALDISAIGLRKAHQLAERRGVPIKLGLMDLERQPLPPGPFDLIVCAHYKQPSLTQPITDALAPDGILVVELHTLDNLKYHPRPSKPHLVEPNELLGWFPGLYVVHYKEAVIDRYALAQLIARKPGKSAG